MIIISMIFLAETFGVLFNPAKFRQQQPASSDDISIDGIAMRRMSGYQHHALHRFQLLESPQKHDEFGYYVGKTIPVVDIQGNDDEQEIDFCRRLACECLEMISARVLSLSPYGRMAFEREHGESDDHYFSPLQSFLLILCLVLLLNNYQNIHFKSQATCDLDDDDDFLFS
jgi:hypothetical protein